MTARFALTVIEWAGVVPRVAAGETEGQVSR
jgi:hypothetical protein